MWNEMEKAILTLSDSSSTPNVVSYKSKSMSPEVILWDPEGISNTVNLNWATYSPEEEEKLKIVMQQRIIYYPGIWLTKKEGNTKLQHETTPKVKSMN